MTENEPNPYQPRRTSLLTFSVNASGDIFFWLIQPDLVLEFHPGDYYYDALLRWCKAKNRREEKEALPEIVEELEAPQEQADTALREDEQETPLEVLYDIFHQVCTTHEMVQEWPYARGAVRDIITKALISSIHLKREPDYHVVLRRIADVLNVALLPSVSEKQDE